MVDEHQFKAGIITLHDHIWNFYCWNEQTVTVADAMLSLSSAHVCDSSVSHALVWCSVVSPSLARKPHEPFIHSILFIVGGSGQSYHE
jgi:hypothetical protein